MMAQRLHSNHFSVDAVREMRPRSGSVSRFLRCDDVRLKTRLKRLAAFGSVVMGDVGDESPSA